MFIDITFFGKIAFQSPRPRKFVSNLLPDKKSLINKFWGFQSPRSGKFVSDTNAVPRAEEPVEKFQSPRSGKFVLDLFTAVTLTKRDKCFNPLNRGNLYLIAE